MAEEIHSKRCGLGNLTVTKFNRHNGIGIYLLDLDHEGARLETPFPLSPQFPVEFCFSIPGKANEFQASGRVMSKQPLTVAPGRYYLKVKFYVPRWDLDNLLRRN